MGIDVELWRARIGTFNGGKGSRKLRALLAFRRLYLRDPVALATGETTNCTPVAVQASIACLSLWLILRFLGSCWNKIKSTHPTKFNGGLSYHWSKDPKAPVSITLSIAVVVAIAVLLHSLTILLLRAGDVELNPGPIMNTPLTLADLHKVHKQLYEARTVWFNIGQCLAVDNETLRSIRRDQQFGNDGDRLNEMLDCRLKSREHLTWATLCDCLRDPIVARNDLANDIEEKLKDLTEQEGSSSVGSSPDAAIDKKSTPILTTSDTAMLNSSCGSQVEEHTAGKASQGGTFNAATSTSPIQDPRVSEDYQSASEQVHLCFPCLDVTSLNKREEEILCFSLWQQSKELRSEFSDLCTSTYLSLERRNVLINKLVICITGDDSLKSFVEDQNKSILADRKKELFEAKDISKVWEIAGDYISFFNYYLIEKIIKRFGTKKDKETLAEYKTSFTEYAKRSFRQSPAEYVSRNETDSVIKVKLGAPKYEHSTLDQLEQFIDELSKLLKLTHAGVIRLCRILPGCVELTLLAPSFVESAVFPLSPDQEAALKALGVIRLRCGVYTYPSETEDGHSQEDSDNYSDDDPPSSPVTEQIELSELMPLNSLSNKSPGSHSDSGYSTLTMEHTGSETYKSRTIETDLHMDFQELFNPYQPEDPCTELPSITELHVAAFNGDLIRVKSCIEVLHCKAFQWNIYGNTVLHTAAIAGHLNVIKYLVKISDNPSPISRGGLTPLHLAAHNGHLPLVEYFIGSQSLDPEVTTENEKLTPLHGACINGDPIVVEYLVQEAQKYYQLESIINCKTQAGNTFLHFAASSGNVDLVKYLTVNLNMDPNVSNPYGVTPLHAAAHYNYLKVVEYFASFKGCNISATERRFNWNALQFAVHQGNVDIVKFFLANKKFDANIKDSVGRTLLHLAVFSHRLETVNYLLKKVKSVSTLDNNNFTSLHYAASFGSFDIAKILVAYDPPSIICKANDGCTALHHAVMRGHLDIVQFLTANNHCNPLSSDNKGNTPVHLAAHNGHLEIVKFFIEDVKCDPNTINGDREMPIHAACAKGHTDVVRYLLEECKCDKSATESIGRTPLHYAATGGELSTVELLTLENQCDPMCRDNKGNTPVHLAAHSGHLEIVKFFIEDVKCDSNTINGDREMPIHAACAKGHTDVVRYLLEECRCDKSATENNGRTPLHYAATGGELSTIKLLTLEKECDPVCRDNEGNTPLHLATNFGHLEAIKFLVNDLHCDPNTPNNKGLMPIHAACQTGQTDAAKYLIDDCKCNESALDENDFTPLHHTASGGKLDIVKYLTLEKMCDPTCKTRKGDTPLHLATHRGHLDVVVFFIHKLNCVPNGQNNAGTMPIHYAALGGNTEIVQFLALEKKCDPMSTNLQGITPLHLAARRGHLNTVTFLVNGLNCDPNTPDLLGKTPITLAKSFNHSKIVKFFDENNKPETNRAMPNPSRHQLHKAAEEGDISTIRRLIYVRKYNPNLPDNLRRCPLHYAAIGGQLAATKYMKLSSADPLSEDVFHNLPLHYAAALGHLDIVKFLVNIGSPYTTRGALNMTPTEMATAGGHFDIVLYLVRLEDSGTGVEVNTIHTSALTVCSSPLHQAAEQGTILAVRDLLQKYTPDNLDSLDRVPLHYAAMGGRLVIIKYLVLSNADPLSEDVFHNLPLHYAAALGHLDIVRFLVNIGSPYTTRGILNMTPTEMATAGGHWDIVEYLNT